MFSLIRQIERHCFSLDRRLADTLKQLYNIEHLTEQQAQVAKAFTTGKDLLIRQPTGTGKTLGILVALLHQQPTSSTLFVVPNRELALQIEQWAHSLLPASSKYRTLQRFVSGTDFEPYQKKVLQRHGAPSIVLGTPRYLLEQPPVDYAQIRQVVVDEVDQLVRLPNKYASKRHIEMRLKKPRPGQQLIDKIIEGRRRSEVRLVGASATCNSQLRNWMYKRQWLRSGNTQEVTQLASNNEVKHYCLVIENEDAVRNFQPATTPSSNPAEKQTVWEQDIMKRTDQQHLQVMEIMAEVVWNVLQQMDTPGSVLMFTRSDAHSTKFKELLCSLYGLEVHDIMDKFSDKQGKIYLATEDSARGLDLRDISLILIIDVPKTTASFQHLAGRTGRLNCQFPGHCQVVTIVPVGRLGWYESKMRSIFSHLHITPHPLPFIS